MADEHIHVRVGNGGRAHLFAPHEEGDLKVFTLADGGTVYDYVLCGAGGALTRADDLPVCRTCERVASG